MTTFQDLGVREDLLRAIAELGYESPMPIQEKVIPHLLNEDSDVVGLAQTGTGKTAAFGLPTLQRVDTTTKVTQAIILDPTRELCMQTCNDLNDYAKYIDDLRICQCMAAAVSKCKSVPCVKACKSLWLHQAVCSTLSSEAR